MLLFCFPTLNSIAPFGLKLEAGFCKPSIHMATTLIESCWNKYNIVNKITLLDTVVHECDSVSVTYYLCHFRYWLCFSRPQYLAERKNLAKLLKKFSTLLDMWYNLIHNCLVQSLSHIWLFVTLWTAARQASLSITNSQRLLKLMPIESVMPSNHLIFCCPLLLPPSTFPSIRVFSNESVLHIRWPKYWSFRISHSNEYSGLISFRMDWVDLLAAQGTLKSLLQHHSSKESILQHSGSFIA